MITQACEQGVLAYRQEYSTYGSIRIAQALQAEFPQVQRGTIARILRQAQLTQTPQPKPEKWKIPVGRHRVQMDVQQLPAIEVGQGFEYKISLTHLSTRVKYSEIHSECTRKIVAGVFQRDLDQLPFFIVFTDNAMIFTMRYTAHPERKTAFTLQIGFRRGTLKLTPLLQTWRRGWEMRALV